MKEKDAASYPTSEGYLVFDPELCTGCHVCEAICSFVKEGHVWPAMSRIRVHVDPFGGTIENYMPQPYLQCDIPHCMLACPVEGAMYVDELTGGRVINETNCTGCRKCIEACGSHFHPQRLVFLDVKDMLKLGQRVRNLERAIMVREGRRREDDTLLNKFFTEKANNKLAKNLEILGGIHAHFGGKVPGPDGHWIELSKAIDRKKWENLKNSYYAERGWDKATGIPKRSKLEELDLSDIAEDLEKLGFYPKEE